MRTRGIVVLGATLIAAVGWVSVVAAEPESPKRPAAAEKPSLEQLLDRPLDKPWRTHRDAGNLPLLDPANWQIRGCTVFTPEEIRRAVAHDEDILLAAHPSAPADQLGKLLILLEQKVLDGYLTHGFPEAHVRARRVEKQIIIDVFEGPWSIAGPVEIKGTKLLDKQQLLARLTEPYIPADAEPGAFELGTDGKTQITWLKGTSLQRPKDPVWEIGKPAAFTDSKLETLGSHLARACADQGRPDAKFELKIQRQPDTLVARLRIRITDEGPTLAIKKVEVAGCRKSTPQQVIDYLQIPPSTVWTRERELLVKERLWRSGRFRNYELKTRREPKSAEVTLLVKVAELEVAPPLSEPLTAIDEAFLKFRDFLGTLPSTDEELVCTWTNASQQVEAIISPRQGAVFSYRYVDEKGEAGPTYSGVFSTDALALYSAATGRRLLARPLPGNLLMTFEFKVDHDSDGDRGRLLAGIGAYTWATAPPGAPALRSLILAPPAAFVYTTRTYSKTCQLRDGVLTVRIPDEEEDKEGDGDEEAEKPKQKDAEQPHPEHNWLEFRVSAKTGRLISMAHDSDAVGHVRVGLATNAYRSRAAGLEREFLDKANEFDPREPLGSTLAFVAREAERSQLFSQLDALQRLMIKSGRKALAGHVLQPLDEWLVRLNETTAREGTGFWLGSWAKNVRQWRGTNPETVFTVWSYGGDLAAPGSWLSDLVRESVLASVGLDRYAPMEVAQHLNGAADGPLADLAAAMVLSEAGYPHVASRFAQRGLQCLDKDKFHADVVSLLDERGLAGRWLRRIGEVARQLGEDDLAVLAARQNIHVQLLVQALSRELAKAPQQPIAEALSEALDRLWDSHVEPLLSDGLEAYRDSRPPPWSVPGFYPSTNHPAADAASGGKGQKVR